MNQNQTNEEMEIDLLDLASKLLDKWYYLLLCLLAGAVLLNAYAFFFIEPTYDSTSKLYVVSAYGNSGRVIVSCFIFYVLSFRNVPLLQNQPPARYPESW